LLEQTTDEQLHKMLDTNLWGTIITCREALKHFGNDGGSIINIGSMSSERFSAGAVAYTASKAGITGVTGVLAVELASRGIRVNQINPGAVDTEGARAIGAMSDEARAAHIARAPLGRVGTPADIASVAVFLASDEAGWLTGECLAVSGGLR
jgi:3-oxoacyl-[acyl-carrier protein] reductase